ncbi:anion permease [Sansalvadorimonas sp. 2012CJ34-2]|uniref:Phosphate transporter n=1 Tax=Parendozoicomonas callyspongiae TaxID=2942213 RepID=A0ABT0PKF1_9GAMM|nr:inorganic phosphate transporter [Sansalvadorimonas sp. 2012CJ34-2]MCL6271726.1 anion permease [Sansalvadorimonas sp. 2012CJ34-2]
MTFLFFLSSGLFLGWSLGANDAANVFGSAVGSRMIRFTTAAIICSVFIMLGAVVSGAGAAHTLGKLGAINALGGAFATALAAAITVYAMSYMKLPVSTSQAIVGAIIGWNFFSGSNTDFTVLQKIVMTWVLCPILSGITAVLLYKLVGWILDRAGLHLITLDGMVRYALIAAGAFGSFSLGANNIGNVMGVFIASSPFSEISFGPMIFSPVQVLFMLGGLAIALGVFTYSKRVMMTVGSGLMPLTPVAAFVVVIAHSIVLFLFASEGLEYFLASNGMPTIPLVPLSSSQAVVGAIIGIGLLKGGHQIHWRVVGKIACGWATTPAIAFALSLFTFLLAQNLFMVKVFEPISYQVTPPVIEKLADMGVHDHMLKGMEGEVFSDAEVFKDSLREETDVEDSHLSMVVDLSRKFYLEVDLDRLDMDQLDLEPQQLEALNKLNGKTYEYSWQLTDELTKESKNWAFREKTVLNKPYNRHLETQFEQLFRAFSIL